MIGTTTNLWLFIVSRLTWRRYCSFALSKASKYVDRTKHSSISQGGEDDSFRQSPHLSKIERQSEMEVSR